MSTIDFKEFDLEGLSLEEMETVDADTVEKIDVPVNKSAHESVNKPENSKIEIQARTAAPIDAEESYIEESIELVETAAQAENAEEQIICPKCELEQLKVEQCAGCGVYIEKAMAQIGQSKIQITATKF
jgi:hypothetical protein